MIKPREQGGYQIKITLRWTDPPIWRSVCIPNDLSLAGLHQLIQNVMGWEDCHMYQFKHKQRIIGAQELADFGEEVVNSVN